MTTLRSRGDRQAWITFAAAAIPEAMAMARKREEELEPGFDAEDEAARVADLLFHEYRSRLPSNKELPDDDDDDEGS
jgi:hypothetical protein